MFVRAETLNTHGTTNLCQTSQAQQAICKAVERVSHARNLEFLVWEQSLEKVDNFLYLGCWVLANDSDYPDSLMARLIPGSHQRTCKSKGDSKILQGNGPCSVAIWERNLDNYRPTLQNSQQIPHGGCKVNSKTFHPL
jgi:hypothetical protein